MARLVRAILLMVLLTSMVGIARADIIDDMLVLFGLGTTDTTEMIVDIPKGEPDEVICSPYGMTERRGNNYNLILYSGIQYIKEDNFCKNITEARSLKKSGVKCIVIKETKDDPDVVCDDWNFTTVILKNISGTGIVPIRIDSPSGEKEEQPLDFSTKSSYDLKIELVPGEILHIGNTSTTITLQNPNSENMADAQINQTPNNENLAYFHNLSLLNASSGGNDTELIFMFNTSAIPTDATIVNASLILNIISTGLDFGETYYISALIINDTNYQWNETNITYNSRPTFAMSPSPFIGTRGTPFNVSSSSVPSLSNWTIRMSEAAASGFINNPRNMSIYIIPEARTGGFLATSDTILIASKDENAFPNRRPKLNISYDLPPSAPSAYCLQEHSNQSSENCSISGGNYSQSGVWTEYNNTHDGDYGSTGGVDVPNDGTFYATYIKSSNSSNQSLWQVKTAQDIGTNGRNFTIPSSCWSNVNLTFKINISSLGVSSNGYCLSGNTYIPVFSDLVGSALYEEAMWYYVNNSLAKTERCTCNDGLNKDWGVYMDLACSLEVDCNLGTGHTVFFNTGTINISKRYTASSPFSPRANQWVVTNSTTRINITP